MRRVGCGNGLQRSGRSRRSKRKKSFPTAAGRVNPRGRRSLCATRRMRKRFAAKREEPTVKEEEIVSDGGGESQPAREEEPLCDASDAETVCSESDASENGEVKTSARLP